MPPLFLTQAICALLLFSSTSLLALERPLTAKEAEHIGRLIWKNECKSSVNGLVSWNAGEEFASLGIGHFIWYPKDKEGPFEEMFPKLLQFLKANGALLPKWLQSQLYCPWSSREEFQKEASSTRVNELRQLLVDTISLQTLFIVSRFEHSLPLILENIDESKKQKVLLQIERLTSLPEGYYALIDYLNFKGEGTSLKERYHGEGWGLLQVLENMGNSPSAINDFVESAKMALKKRVQNSPPERNEDRWLKGWYNRLDTYLTK